jgi:hypothetical protein
MSDRVIKRENGRFGSEGVAKRGEKEKEEEGEDFFH